MGNWSPYSEYWEKQRVKKIIKEAKNTHAEFEKKPRIYKKAVKFYGTIQYYCTLLSIHIHRVLNRKYRDEMDRAVDGLEEKTSSRPLYVCEE